MKNLFILPLIASVMYLTTMTAGAQPTSLELAQAFVCAAKGKCLLRYDNPEVQAVHADLADLNNFCRNTKKGVVAISDRIAFANAKLDTFQNLMDLMHDFKPIAQAHCSSFSIDLMLNSYVLERNHGATHPATVAQLIKNPERLLKKWRGKKA
jgi:hypothetical protein